RSGSAAKARSGTGVSSVLRAPPRTTSPSRPGRCVCAGRAEASELLILDVLGEESAQQGVRSFDMLQHRLRREVGLAGEDRLHDSPVLLVRIREVRRQEWNRPEDLVDSGA